MSVNISRSLRESLQDIHEESKVAATLLSDFTINEAGNYVDYSNGKVTFLPKSVKEADRDAWLSTKRQGGKPARIIRQFIREDVVELELTDQDFEIFTNKLKATDISEMVNISLVNGNDIKSWYDGTKYARRRIGTLESSCMRYENCQSFFKLYTENPTRVKMLIAVHKETNELYARSLVWYTEEGDIVQDRVYGTDAMIQMMKDYAKAQGWWVRSRNSYYDETEFLNPQGEHVTKTWRIPLDNHVFRQYPYMDTFKYFNMTEGWITNDFSARATHTLGSTTGRAERR